MNSEALTSPGAFVPPARDAAEAPLPREEGGLWGFLTTVDHKRIGFRQIVTALALFVFAGLLAGAMRLQLAVPENELIGPDRYDQLFTTHGTTMMFLFAVPVMEAMAVYLVPLMVGTRNIAFPRMVAYSYWVYLAGGIYMIAAFAVNVGPDAGWFNYVPLAGPQYGIGKRSDFWCQLITFTEVSGLMQAVAVITTVFKLRAPGMSIERIPLFVWAMLVTMFMIMFAMPAVMMSSTTLILDRLVGTHFYNPAEGGDALLWQHLFWFFGHPEVYMIFLPATGIVSALVPTFARRTQFGYPAMVVSLIATGFLAFGLWVHHMFATGVPSMGKGFFTAASMIIAIPTAVQLFCWIATLWTGRPALRVPLWWVLGFFFILVLGGLTGIMLASVPVDLQVHDTFFVVAHLHYVLIGGAVFPLFGGFYYWFPKVTGRLLDERLGRWSFWLFFVGFNVTFFPMHILGLEGMPRRVYTYSAAMGWGTLNLLATCGVALIALSVVIFFVDVARSWRGGEPAGDNPWNAPDLEWRLPSPLPFGNTAPIPVVTSRTPLWTPRGIAGYVRGLSDSPVETLVTSGLDAHPDHRLAMPSPTVWPFVAAAVTTAFFVASIFTPWAVVWGVPPIVIAVTVWFWPTRAEARRHRALEKAPSELPA